MCLFLNDYYVKLFIIKDIVIVVIFWRKNNVFFVYRNDIKWFNIVGFYFVCIYVLIKFEDFKFFK